MVKYSPEEKIEIVKNYLEGNVIGKTYAKSIGVHISMIHQWVKHYRTLGEAAFNKRYTSYSTQYKVYRKGLQEDKLREINEEQLLEICYSEYLISQLVFEPDASYS